jgi:undecaprenyl-diphosphatase
MKLSSSLGQISHWDQTLCVQLNRAGHVTWVRSGFLLVSRLGDGVFWYALMLTLPVWYGPHAWLAVLHMTSVGLVCTFSYKWLKAKTSRPRPFAHNPLILPCAAALDEFSFPSGHTLHAVAFSIVVLSYYPQLGTLVLPFTLLVALSRPVLGLHYPSDVLAGALLGASIAGVSVIF